MFNFCDCLFVCLFVCFFFFPSLFRFLDSVGPRVLSLVKPFYSLFLPFILFFFFACLGPISFLFLLFFSFSRAFHFSFFFEARLSLSFLFFPSFFSLFLFFEPSWASLYFGLVKWLFFIVLTNFLTHAMSHIKLFFKTLKK